MDTDLMTKYLSDHWPALDLHTTTIMHTFMRHMLPSIRSFWTLRPLPMKVPAASMTDR